MKKLYFMTADERQNKKKQNRIIRSLEIGKYTAGIAMLLEEEDIPCFVVGSSALRYYGAALVQSVSSFFFSLIMSDLISFFF